MTTLTILYQERKEWNVSRNGEANDEVWVELREWKSDDGHRLDCILEHRVTVDYEDVLHGCRVIDGYLSHSQMIRHAIAIFDELVANHPATFAHKEAQ